MTEEKVMSETEQSARSQGWVPQEEFKGDNWVDAETFVQRGEKIAAIATKQAKELREELSQIKAEREEDKKIFSEFKKFQDEIRERDKEATENWYRNELSNIKQAKKAAIKEDDRDKLIEIDDYKDIVDENYKVAKEKLKEKEKEKEEKKEEQKADPYFAKWIADNAWYNDDDVMSAYADKVGSKMYKDKFGSNMEFYKKVEEKIREKFPEKFTNPNREKDNAVESGGGRRKAKGKTYDDLPAHAKAACEKFCKIIPGFTKEQYLRDVNWDQLEKENG